MREANDKLIDEVLSNLSDEDKANIIRKILKPSKYCRSAGCFSPRKEKRPNFPQSKYCEHHAKTAKAFAKEFGMYFETSFKK